MHNLIAPDQRFPTSNTSLAAAFLTLFIFLKKVQPTSVLRDAETGKKVFTYYFETEASEEFCGARHVAEEIALAWANRETFEKNRPDHPLIPIRKSLDSRDYLNRVVHREIAPAHSTQAVKFRTEDIMLAACARAAGHPLLRYDERTQTFQFGSVGKKFLTEYGNYGFRNPHPISLMRRVLVARELAIDFIKNKTPKATHYRQGDGSSNEWAECFIPDGMNSKDADVILNRFNNL